MATLEKVMELKGQGKTDVQISEALKNEGISPKEINEALSQSQVKSAINQEGAAQASMMQQSPQAGAQPQLTAPTPPQPQQFTSEVQPEAGGAETGQAQMQPSMMQAQAQAPRPQAPMPGGQQPAEPSQFSQLAQPMEQGQLQGPETGAGQYPEYGYEGGYDEYQPTGATDIETINEIAEQIVEEKTNKLKKQVTAVEKFKDSIILEIAKINERITRIETTLNELQMSIIGKIGDYGKEIKNISKELHATQNSFSKMVNPITDNMRELQKITGETKETKSRPKPKTKSGSKGRNKKPKPSFEDYLR